MSVVDMDVPVTAIDDVLQEYDCKIEEHEVKTFTRTKSSASKGRKKKQFHQFLHLSSVFFLSYVDFLSCSFVSRVQALVRSPI